MVSDDKLVAIQSFLHEKRMSDEVTRGQLRKCEKLAKFACRDNQEFTEVDFVLKGLHWWSDRLQELELYYDSVLQAQMVKNSTLKVGYVAERDPPKYEINCRVCTKLKDYGHKCWWCGN